MTQPQLSVREKAREIYNEQDVIKTFIDITDRLGDKKAREYLDSVMLYLIDQIITLAQEEKIKEVENIMRECQCESCTTDCKGCGEPREYCGGYKGGCDGKSCPRNIALSKVIEILKQ